MNVLVIGHTYSAAINRKKWQAVAGLYPDVMLRVLVPATWPHRLRDLDARNAAQDNMPNLQFFPLPVYAAGDEGRYRFAWRDLALHLQSNRPDIIQVEQGAAAMVYMQVHLLAHWYAPYARTIFFTWVNWAASPSWRFYCGRFWLQAYAMLRSAGAIIGNRAARYYLPAAYDQHKPIVVIPQIGIEVPNVHAPLTKKTRYCIGYAGRLLTEKGIFILLEAFRRCATNFVNWDLLFLGTGPQKAALQHAIAAAQLTDRVKVQDPLPHDQVLEVMRNLDIFVLASYDTPVWREQFGHVLIEAMAMGVPLIGSHAGAIPDVIGDAGLVVSARNVSMLVEALTRYMSSDAIRQRYRDAGIARARRHFSHGAIAQQTYVFWRCLMHGNMEGVIE